MPRTKPAPEYQAWIDMHRRCYNPESKSYKAYGGRGIAVCESWRSFRRFFADMGVRPPKHWLERKDNDKGYGPDNCVWATPKQQARNRRQTANVLVKGQLLCVRDACKLLGFPEHRVYQEVYLHGVTHQQALETVIGRARSNV